MQRAIQKLTAVITAISLICGLVAPVLQAVPVQAAADPCIVSPTNLINVRYEMTRAQWLVIARVHRRPGLSQSEVADLLEIEKASAGRLIDRMEAKGWLTRRADARDRRINRLHLTPTAEHLHATIWPIAETTVDDALGDLSPEERRRLTREEIDERHPRLLPALREHPHIGWLLVRSERDGPLALGPRGTHYLAEGRIDGEDPLAHFSPTAPQHLLRTNGFEEVADIMVGSFYDPELDEGCAFEELISFHGGIGGFQTRPFILYPERLPLPSEPIVGAAAVHGVLTGWRQMLQGAKP